MPAMVIADGTFEVDFKLQEQHDNLRLWFHRNASQNAAQRLDASWNGRSKMSLFIRPLTL
jgi:hypothetical protein